MEPAVTYLKRSRPHRRIEPSWRPLYYFRCGGSPRRRRRSARRPRRGRQGANRAGKKGKKYYQSLQITKSIAATQSRSNVHKRTQGWTVFHLPSTPGRCSLCRPPLGPAVSPNAAAFRVPAASCALGVVPLRRCRRRGGRRGRRSGDAWKWAGPWRTALEVVGLRGGRSGLRPSGVERAFFRWAGALHAVFIGVKRCECTCIMSV